MVYRNNDDTKYFKSDIYGNSLNVRVFVFSKIGREPKGEICIQLRR